MTWPRGRVARLGVLSASHSAADFYQGCVAVLVPLLVHGSGYSYAQATGLVLGATIGSSLAQPIFGMLSDRRARFGFIPASLLVAGLGLGAVGLTSSYAWTMAAVVVSGLGVAAYHPEAARLARQIGGSGAGPMSWFIVGGNLGLLLAPLLAAPLLIRHGTGAVVLLALPGVAAALALVAARGWLAGSGSTRPARTVRTGVDDWRSFRWLACLAVLRAGIYLGVAAFVGVLLIDERGVGQATAAAALALFLAVGTAATLVGGALADRWRRTHTVRLGFALTVPGLALLAWTPNLPVALVGVAITGFGAFLPFSVQTTMGQEYLPTRLATAAGVTIGLSVSAGGAFTPILGLISDHHGPRAAVLALVVLPVLALAASLRLQDVGRPRSGRRQGRQVEVGAPPR